MRRFLAVTMTVTMLALIMAGCGKSDDSAEATEATEAVTEIAITADTAETPTEPVDVEVEEYDFSVTEETTEEETVTEEAEVEVDEFGVASIDEVKLYAKESVRMRKEPNTDSEVAGQLKTGDEVTANGKSEEWHRIIKSNGDTVYVKSEYLTETKPETKEETKKTETADTNKKTTDTAAADAAAAQAAAAQAAANQAAADQAAAAQAAANQAAADQAAAAQAAAAQAAAAATASVGKYKDYDFSEAAIANDWNKSTMCQNTGKTWNQLGEGEKADLANHYSHYGAAGW